MTTISAVFEQGAFRPTAPMNLPEGTRVELVVVPVDNNAPDPQQTAAILAEIAKLPTTPGDPTTSENHDRVLYGEQGCR